MKCEVRDFTIPSPQGAQSKKSRLFCCLVICPVIDRREIAIELACVGTFEVGIFLSSMTT